VPLELGPLLFHRRVQVEAIAYFLDRFMLHLRIVPGIEHLSLMSKSEWKFGLDVQDSRGTPYVPSDGGVMPDPQESVAHRTFLPAPPEGVTELILIGSEPSGRPVSRTILKMPPRPRAG
jgi:hypothetical protein